MTAYLLPTLEDSAILGLRGEQAHTTRPRLGQRFHFAGSRENTFVAHVIL